MISWDAKFGGVRKRKVACKSSACEVKVQLSAGFALEPTSVPEQGELFASSWIHEICLKSSCDVSVSSFLIK